MRKSILTPQHLATSYRVLNVWNITRHEREFLEAFRNQSAGPRHVPLAVLRVLEITLFQPPDVLAIIAGGRYDHPLIEDRPSARPPWPMI